MKLVIADTGALISLGLAGHIDLIDNKARIIAESFNVKCIGSIGLLVRAKQKGLINALRPVFEKWLENKRYFSKKILNKILIQTGEKTMKE